MAKNFIKADNSGKFPNIGLAGMTIAGHNKYYE